MSQRLTIRHRIEHRYARHVALSPHWLRLRPAPHTKCEIEAYSLRIAAQPHFLNWVRDPFENYLGRLDLPEPVNALGLDMELIATLSPVNPFDFLVEPYAGEEPFEYPPQLRKELEPYRYVGRYGPRLEALVAEISRESVYVVERLGDINKLVHERLPTLGIPGVPGYVAVEEVLARGKGSAWEVAWVLTMVLRARGLAARFTSGYNVYLSEDPGKIPDSVRMHAWSEVYLPGAGWIGLDPATGIFTGERHVPLASAPDPLRALPLAGYFESCDERISATLEVQRLTPRPAEWPLAQQVWTDVRAVGAHVDADLRRQNIALHSAAAVCLVSSYNSWQQEWSTAALGPNKRQLAEELLARLMQRIAPGAVRHVGQGEWFSGEPLPRWRLSAFYRSDGHAMCTRSGELGTRHGNGNGNGDQHPQPTSVDMRRFAERLTQRLGIDPQYLMPAHEDVLHELWVSRNELGFTPDAGDLRDPAARRALAEALSQSRGPAIGYVLPLRWDAHCDGWASGPWRFRRPGLYLTPGSSPLGYRLPLESLPAGDERPLDADPERCPFDERDLLPTDFGETARRYSAVSGRAIADESADDEATSARAPRTALCIELRDGRIGIFLPPLTHIEHYLDLLSRIDTVASELHTRVQLEGYEPPEDFRLHRITLEPDAGSLKVWLPAAADFSEQTALLDAVYSEAAALGLRGERIAPDGRRLPPGGVADVTLGGERPDRSPFLVRPELLRSLISYWQRHPSLSYLFAGRFIGPGSNAPRPDEGRDDALYELGMALERIPAGESEHPWMPDRVLRHLLADATGDIRRAEIRIDQLYGPDRSAQRQGRITLRCFETAADPKLAALPLLLLRTLIGYFARHAQGHGLTRWNTALHDRYLLPRLLWDDLAQIISDMQTAGYPLQLAWFEPMLATRFPILGAQQMGDMTLEMRAAHEPWPLLAEEVTPGGVARFVDVATERVQVRLAGLTPARYVLACNGRRVPLHETGVRGEYVAGIRYKVWNPAATLHPTIPPVHSLDLDLIDTWTGRVIGGATYFPPRPGIWGAAGPPPLHPDTEAGARPDERLPPQLAIPAYTTAGVFTPKDPTPRYAIAPTDPADPRYPYLLDLTRLT